MKRILYLLMIVSCLFAGTWQAKALTYTVTVPDGTQSCYITGDMNGWSSFIQMTKVDGTTNQFTIDISYADETNGYKYYSGPDWQYSEAIDASGTPRPDGDNRTYSENDVVPYWQNLFIPAPRTVTIEVKAPEDISALYIAGSYNNWSIDAMNYVGEDSGSKVYNVSIESDDADNINFKILAGPSWDYEPVNTDNLVYGALPGADTNTVSLTVSDGDFKSIYEPSRTVVIEVKASTDINALYISGSYNGWNSNPFDEMSYVGESGGYKVYNMSITSESASNITFKLLSGPAWTYEQVADDSRYGDFPGAADGKISITVDDGYFNAIYDPTPSTLITTVTLKVIDQTKGEITNNVNDNNETNIICWIDDILKSQNPQSPDPTSWWYPMYNDSGITPTGKLIKGDNDWTWQITLNVSPGTYEWNPNAKTLGWAPINPNMYAYTGDDGNNLIFKVSADGTISGHTELVIPASAGQPAQYPVTLKVVDQSKGVITNDTNNNETNIFCWVDLSLSAQNPQSPDPTSWWYPMYNDSGITPTGQLVKGTDDWTWEITLNATPGTYEWNPYAKSLGWNSINPTMYPYIGDDGYNLIFTVADDGTISGHTELVIPASATPPVQYPVTLKVIDQSKGKITNKVDDNNETNIVCWFDNTLQAQNPRTPGGDEYWWYPMYNDPDVTPTGELIKGDNDWTWEITLNAAPGTYDWNPIAKTLGWVTINKGMYDYTGDDGDQLIFTVSNDGTISGHSEVVIPDNSNTGISGVSPANTVVTGDKSSISALFEGTATVTVYSIQGKLIKKETAQSQFNVGDLPAGIYLVKVNSEMYKVIVH